MSITLPRIVANKNGCPKAAPLRGRTPANRRPRPSQWLPQPLPPRSPHPFSPSENPVGRPKKTKPPKPDISTPRTRRLRQRRKLGLVCISVPLHRAQIGELVYQGRLPENQRSNRKAIQNVIANILRDLLMPKTQFLVELRSRWEPVPPAAPLPDSPPNHAP